MDAASEGEVARLLSAYVQGIGIGKYRGIAVCCADQGDDGLARAASGLRLFSIARVIEVIVAFLHTKAPFDFCQTGLSILAGISAASSVLQSIYRFNQSPIGFVAQF